ncbi:MAG TPA: DUF456 domain-containing protein [Candidatus Paceibacterota bacterium]|nr:DUF456 domain-containing protein [Candidatus Paceibacterota bacterium]
MVHSIAYITALVLLAPAILMAFVPMLPALTYMFVVALAFGVIDRFTALSGMDVLILLCISLTSIVIDHTSGLLGAKYGGAHTKSLLWGMLGAFAGLFIFPAFGSFIGLFCGVLIAELYFRRKHEDRGGKALKAAGSALLGTAVGVAVNVALSIVFLILFTVFALN